MIPLQRDCQPSPPLPGATAAASRRPPLVVVPRLLVSVRNGLEAVAALRGGAELLDIKAPERGSLGRPDPQAVRDVLAIRDTLTPTVPVSVALGELAEWADDASRIRDWLPAGISFAKVGLAGYRGRNWVAPWQALQAAAPPAVRWVSVAYADARAASAPDLPEVITTATRRGCAGVLVDTHSKQQGGLLDHLSPEVLAASARRLHTAGLFWALAGRLSLADLPRLVLQAVDVVAVRSAVCFDEDRLAEVEPTRVALFRTALRRLWSDSTVQSLES
jgi:uncharacterized protein (UPF0264 family)